MSETGISFMLQKLTEAANDDDICTSFDEKLNTAGNLAISICYDGTDEHGYFTTPRKLDTLSKDDTERLWGYVDGLVHKHHYNMQIGRCSIKAMIDYDIAKEELSIDNDISNFTKILADLTGN